MSIATSPVMPTTTPKLPSSLERAIACARTASQNKATDILVLDLTKITVIFDYFVISTGTSRRQIHAIAEDTDATMRSLGDHRDSIEGYEASKWILQDYGDVLVHVFDPETRDYYKLEELWADAPRIDWQNA
ncbi:ribosome silencing factor [Tuwongella immobilis]|uniref:Ribosomal silencing factor RsfS n=1 Tax=Tuwongella immobilis TaxID=692036 RepID=A0A6C2YNE1_9BACT|nr:ribosome silencing factor [Tuwongella immobilis]VIP03140.1 iojap-related protein : Ribosomal silencing factor RsfS OS=Planctomyces brasiliensis (strain ATCC 49424 / DSM 5305 / JCM 21570 / NBRC 103401 / IFAM 1448) GN=rsfS PE=3 SV=1: Oligomerisation [Tuwongella immobilis]VTS03508.1 iojap-related protein : Ribosomal silencing factor RsfS OS=Planctomyces brasiliensis (strain ATCC 49424 / DSM 5305 / JCM 21570 / NBRC 103401 / IFAM 1448) GN=rsfS PE=3 SV=1: Oligomerisation [Tuwongella immobilis]